MHLAAYGVFRFKRMRKMTLTQLVYRLGVGREQQVLYTAKGKTITKKLHEYAIEYRYANE